MRQFRVVFFFTLFLVAQAGLGVSRAHAQSGKILSGVTFRVAGPGNTPLSIQIFVDGMDSKKIAALTTAVSSISSWMMMVGGHPSPVHIRDVKVIDVGLIELELDTPVNARVMSHGTGGDTVEDIVVWFAGDSSTGLRSGTVTLKMPRNPKKNGLFFPKFHFSTDKQNSIVNVSGSLQSGVGARPQYQWNALAKVPIEYNASTWMIFGLVPQFTGVASQETNADPDSLSAGLPIEFYFPFTHVSKKSLPINILVNPIDYEFERKAKQEAVLENGQPTLHNYQQKNTNRIVSAQMQFAMSLGEPTITSGSDDKSEIKIDPVALSINLGTEVGSAISRSVLNVTAQPSYSDNPLRAVGGADVYFDLPKLGKYPFLNVDGHYTVRSLFHSEPFKQAGVNDGNEFYSTKARHHIAVNLTRTLVKGSNFTVQYQYGSLPPTFTFVDHQVTIGFNVLLGK